MYYSNANEPRVVSGLLYDAGYEAKPVSLTSLETSSPFLIYSDFCAIQFK